MLSSVRLPFTHAFITPVLLCSLLGLSAPAYADIQAVASIKPVHSLVSLVMGDKGKASLLIDGAASPHTYALTPQQAREMQNADVIFWVGEHLEAFLKKPLQTVGAGARHIELMATPGVKTLSFREGGAFEAHAHDDHAHKDHDDHEGHDDHGHKDHDHKDHAHKDHDDHDGHDGHAHSADETDPHIWLSPDNAKAMLHHIAHVLGELDPDHKAEFDQNADQAASRIDQLTASIKADLDPVKEGEFIVFHDAYHYFEDRFGLQAAGAISLSPERMPGAQRVAEIRALLQDDHIRCVFTEPQFEPRIVTTILEETNKKLVEIDPLGAAVSSGPEMYFALLNAMRTSFLNCLGK
ncbi:ABC-type Zn2+ transport system, periplasmic component/surface adhesin [SAR116 cluster alpha proteobacterium HIMB100]|nr:ABC-type Zn2+ transport system, periplasmic component/surface adhesin [SAR116 cluster alpha proteobacterium HIMB100]